MCFILAKRFYDFRRKRKRRIRLPNSLSTKFYFGRHSQLARHNSPSKYEACMMPLSCIQENISRMTASRRKWVRSSLCVFKDSNNHCRKPPRDAQLRSRYQVSTPFQASDPNEPFKCWWCVGPLRAGRMRRTLSLQREVASCASWQ